MWSPKYNWRFETDPDPNMNGRRIYWPRGKTLGGSSSINGLIYIRGQREDFDDWGVPGWGFDDLLPCFLRSEDQQRGASAWHGAGGPIAVSDLPDRHELCDAFIASAQANVAVLKAQQTEASRTLAELTVSRDQAKRNLDFTFVRAPFDGIIGNRAVQVGQLVQAGTRLLALVPISKVYVDANFKETQLGRLHPGQRVDVEVDAFPGRAFHGRVVSIAPASGSVFSLLPPENATGNFTKIVQRVPVRIELDEDARQAAVLRPGMSVTATVDTRG
jgi:choline dehydrogenase-like flavoprotein